MPKVTQILYSGLGGHASVVFSMLEATDSAQWESTLGFIGIEPMADGFAKFCYERSIPYKYFAQAARKPWKNWPAIFSWLRGEQSHTVISHNPSVILPVWLYAKLTGARVVFVEHTSPPLKTKSEWLLSALSMCLADHIIVLTEEQKHCLHNRLGFLFPKQKVILIANGINTTRFFPLDKPWIPHRVIRVGMAARFTSSKKQDCLVAAISHLRTKRPEINWQLSLPGNGVTWELIDAQVERSGLSHCINLPGLLNQNQILDWYRKVDIYVHVTEGETLSTSILQAMAMQLPIIASDVSGVRNLIADANECGTLVEGFNPEYYADAISDLVDNPGRARQMAKRGRLQCIAKYSHEGMFAKYNAIVCAE